MEHPPSPTSSPVSEMVSLELDALSVRERYRLLLDSVIPRPIAFVSTVGNDGSHNLAPFSFFNAVSSNPASLMVSIARKSDGSKKDTLRNIEETGQFVVNSANEWILEPLVQCGAEYPYGVDEMAKSGLTPIPSTRVKPPRVREAAWQFECELHTKVELGNGDPGSTTLVIGRILVAHVSAHVYQQGRIDPKALRPVARLGGISYSTLGSIIDLAIPKINS